jgi:hypothetical protein
MNQSVKYRQNASECYVAASIPTDLRQKANLLVMAHSWISLADHGPGRIDRAKVTAVATRLAARNGTLSSCRQRAWRLG